MLIDSTKAEKRIKGLFEKHDDVWSDIFNAGVYACLKIIQDMIENDSIESEPIKHGKWKLTEEPMGWGDESCAECSECGESFVLDEYSIDDISAEFKFCPNCGAKMDEVNDETKTD